MYVFKCCEVCRTKAKCAVAKECAADRGDETAIEIHTVVRSEPEGGTPTIELPPWNGIAP
jgi:hypothetical protein